MAIGTALQSHPLLQSARARAAAAESVVAQARLRPNPRLYLQTENWRGNPSFSPSTDTDTYAYVSQAFETGGKRNARTEVARSGVRRAELERELLARQITVRVKIAYWAAAGAARVAQAQRENAANFQQVIDYHEARVREGAMPEADLLRVRIERERLELAANGAELDAERARIDLFRAMGRADFPEARFVESLEGLVNAPAADPEAAVAQRAELKLAREIRASAAANASLQRSLVSQDVDIVFGYKHTAGFSSVLGGMQWNLPFFNRNQGNIGAAEASIRVADAEIAAAEAAVRAEVKAAEADYRIRSRQVSGTLERIMKRAQESAAIALAAYREGGSDLLRLLDAQRVRIELETLYYRSLAEYRQSVAALESAMGVVQ